MRRVLPALPWVAFAAVLLTLAFRDLSTNPVLDERHYVQAGLAAARHGFLKTGFSSGPFYPLGAGVLFSFVYGGGRLAGAFASTADFMAWYLTRPALLFLLGRLLTAGMALGGLALLARSLAPRTGAAAASWLCLGFAFTAPSLERLAFATPHACLIGCAAATLAALSAASEGRSPKAWIAAGALGSLSTCTMTIGLGLFLPTLWTAALLPQESDGLDRGARFRRAAAGAALGLLAFGLPILLHPLDYWNENIQYQLQRQALSDFAGDGNLLWTWTVQGATLWILGPLGVWLARPGKERVVAAGAALTAFGYLLSLAFLTRSRQPAYSLASLPCLAVAAAGVLPAWRAKALPLRLILCAAVFALPAGHGVAELVRRMSTTDPKVEAARRMVRLIPPGSTVLVDAWHGPRIANRALLLQPYAASVPEWSRDPAFVRRLERDLPAEHNCWDVVVYPEERPSMDAEGLRRRGIRFAVISNALMTDPRYAAPWEQLLREGVVQPLEPRGAGGIGFYSVRP